MSRKRPRIFVEWYDPNRLDWGGYVNSECKDFQQVLLEFVSECGPPTKVEYRETYDG